jgi:hypothetical protein
VVLFRELLSLLPSLLSLNSLHPIRYGTFSFFFPFFFCLLPSSRIAAQHVEIIRVSKKNPEFAEKIHIESIKDAGKLNDHLYRGTQPNEHGLRALKKLGVTMIVDLRGESRRESTNKKKKRKLWACNSC